MEIVFHSYANNTHFHKKGCEPSLSLKVTVLGTRKWPITLMHQVDNQTLLPMVLCCAHSLRRFLNRTPMSVLLFIPKRWKRNVFSHNYSRESCNFRTVRSVSLTSAVTTTWVLVCSAYWRNKRGINIKYNWHVKHFAQRFSNNSGKLYKDAIAYLLIINIYIYI